MPTVQVQGLTKTYGATDRHGSVVVFDQFSLNMHRGQFTVLFGPNACGKTTLLNIIAGITPPDGGTVLVDGKEPGGGAIGYIFQGYVETLFPWARAIDNVAYPLAVQGIGRAERRKRAERFLAELDINVPLNAWPDQLSGGQQQLIAIARALICQPKLLLFDEPFSALDTETRYHMRSKLQDLWLRTGSTILFVSHDLDEALLLADQVLVLSKRPAQILETLAPSFPRPRLECLMERLEFFELRRRALKVYREALQG